MKDSKDLVGSLPGSTRGDKDRVGVTNHVLMPKTDKLPGHNPAAAKSASIPDPHLLGSGSKIPQSQESRMRSQFASPDPAIYDPKRLQRNPDVSSSGTWWQERPMSVGCTPYHSGAGDVKVDAKGKVISTIRAEKVQAEKAAIAAAKEKANSKGERKRLEGQKEAMLGQLCTDPGATSYAPETRRIVNIVMNINKQLGLPVAHTNHWKLPQ